MINQQYNQWNLLDFRQIFLTIWPNEISSNRQIKNLVSWPKLISPNYLAKYLTKNSPKTFFDQIIRPNIWPKNVL